jgi:hypothetical protein
MHSIIKEMSNTFDDDSSRQKVVTIFRLPILNTTGGFNNKRINNRIVPEILDGFHSIRTLIIINDRHRRRLSACRMRRQFHNEFYVSLANQP